MIHDSTPDRFKFEWSFLTAQFASWTRQTKTNKDRIRFYGDLRHLALKHNVLDLLPAIRLQPTDVGLAHLATKYATDHYFAPSYLRKRIWALSPIVITDNKASDVFPLTKQVLEGITRLREIKHPLGVVLGKDTLAYFNSSLNPNQNYLDLLFYTFDLICTTICSRSGALAPDLSDPDRIHAIITLDQLKIGKTWLKDIPISDKRKFLLSLITHVKTGKVTYFRFWINKPKMHTAVVRPFLVHMHCWHSGSSHSYFVD